MARAGQKDQIQIISFDDPVQVNENKVLSRYGSPMSDDLLFDHIAGKGLSEERVLQKVQLAGRKIVCGAPPGIHLSEKFVCDGTFLLTGQVVLYFTGHN